MRESFRYLVVGLSLLIVAGCSDSGTMPSAPQPRRLSASGPAFDFSSGGERQYGTRSDDFALTSRGGSFSLNDLFTVTFPEGSVCDPDLSSYGEGEWNSSCVTLSGNRSIRVTVTTRLTSGGLAIDFQPALRFSPDKQVTIATDVFAPLIRANREYFSKHPTALRPLALYYTTSIGSTRIADYIDDSSLITHIDLRSGRVWRRVKHFSGYSIVAGTPCEPSPDDPDCIAVGGI